MIYNILDRLVMNDFSETILSYIKNNQKCVVFDVGCFQGNFSRNLKKKMKSKKVHFYLFDANPLLKIEDFKYNNIALSKTKKISNFHLNSFFPSSGSSLKKIVKQDKYWNLTRKFLSLNIGKDFKTFKVHTDTLDNFCKKKKIKKIDILKIDVEGAEMDVLNGANKILNNTNILQVEILGTKDNFKRKYEILIKFLKKKKFKLIKEKNIWSVSILSNIKSKDLLLVKNKNENYF